MVRKVRSYFVAINLLLCLALALAFVPAGLAGEVAAEETEIYLPLVMRRPVPFTESSGVLDPSFSSDGRATANLAGGMDFVNGAALQPDGKLVIVGAALTQVMDDIMVARYNPDGSLDASFSEDGKVLTDFYGDDFGRAVAIQSDGKIVVAGISWTMDGNFTAGRYNADGTLDTTFGDGGKVTTDINSSSTDYPYALAIQQDGKILVAGSTETTGVDFALVRYNPNGALDTSFDFDGKLYTNMGLDDECFAIVVQADGKILLAGYATTAVSRDFALARYNSDGTLDTSFDGDGKVLTDFAAGSDRISSLALQADGKIVAAGQASGESIDFALARYNADGSLDTDFDADGKLMVDFDGAADYAKSVVVQPDGKIAAVGYIDRSSNDDFALLRVSATGVLDAGFDGDGRLITDFAGGNDIAYSLLRQADGRLLAAGMGMVQEYDVAVARYNPDGSLDDTYADGGKLLSDLIGSADEGYAAVLQPDGKILVAGTAWGINFDVGLARFNLDGSLDTSFAGDGTLTTDLDGTDEYGRAVALQADGKILVAGYRYHDSNINQDFLLLRYTADGSLDLTFNGVGYVITDFSGENDKANALVVQADGKIILAGDSYGAFHGFALARFNADGSLDPTFDGDGLVVTQFTDYGAVGASLALQADGKIVVGGYVDGLALDFGLARYNTNGSLDTSFDGDGWLTTDFDGYADICLSVLVQPDGKILAGGANDNPSNDNFAMARYNADGSLDPTFDGDGKVQFDISGSNDRGYSLARQPNGKIIFSGYAALGLRDFAVARFNVDGSVDTSFGSNGFVTTDFFGNYDYPHALLLQPDGRIVLAGNASDGVNGNLAIVRYK